LFFVVAHHQYACKNKSEQSHGNQLPLYLQKQVKAQQYNSRSNKKAGKYPEVRIIDMGHVLNRFPKAPEKEISQRYAG
jgi:hypothetical protein